MKIENMKKAAEAAAQYERAVANLEWTKKATHFNAECGPHDGCMRIERDPVHIDQAQYSGALANDLKSAIVRFREGMVELAAQRLRELGIET